MDDIAEKVDAILRHCLYKSEEISDGKVPADAVEAKGILHNFYFHPQRLESHREDVAKILVEMPSAFHRTSGGGWSFLQLCMDKNDNQWGEHSNMEQLVCLAIGLGMGKYCMPRDLWPALPGGMPYVVFDLEGHKTQKGD